MEKIFFIILLKTPGEILLQGQFKWMIHASKNRVDERCEGSRSPNRLLLA